MADMTLEARLRESIRNGRAMGVPEHYCEDAYQALQSLTARIAELEEKLNVMAGREHRVAEVDMNLAAREIHLDHRISDFEAQLAGTEGPIAESELEDNAEYLCLFLSTGAHIVARWRRKALVSQPGGWHYTLDNCQPIRKLTPPAAAEGGEN